MLLFVVDLKQQLLDKIEKTFTSGELLVSKHQIKKKRLNLCDVLLPTFFVFRTVKIF